MGSDFQGGKQTEAEAFEKLFSPLMGQWMHRGFVRLDHKTSVFDLQTYGDYLGISTINNRPTTIEHKAERRHTGNLFIETYSDFPKRRGWIYTSLAEYLWYGFLDTKTVYIFDMQQLKRWAIDNNEANLKRFCRPVNIDSPQANKTCGWVARIDLFASMLIESHNAPVGVLCRN